LCKNDLLLLLLRLSLFAVFCFFWQARMQYIKGKRSCGIAEVRWHVLTALTVEHVSVL